MFLFLESVENSPTAGNKSEIVTSESKKKSHTIPRSKSLLDKKSEFWLQKKQLFLIYLNIFFLLKKDERVTDNMKSCGSQASTPSSSREVWNLKISIYYWLIDWFLFVLTGITKQK